jgi:hypothetical protein
MLSLRRSSGFEGSKPLDALKSTREYAQLTGYSGNDSVTFAYRYVEIRACLALFAENFAEEARLFGVVGMTLAAILLCYSFERNFNVLATA